MRYLHFVRISEPVGSSSRRLFGELPQTPACGEIRTGRALTLLRPAIPAVGVRQVTPVWSTRVAAELVALRVIVLRVRRAPLNFAGHSGLFDGIGSGVLVQLTRSPEAAELFVGGLADG